MAQAIDSKEIAEAREAKIHRERLESVINHIESHMPPSIHFVLGVTDDKGEATCVKIKANALNSAKLVYHLKEVSDGRISTESANWVKP